MTRPPSSALALTAALVALGGCAAPRLAAPPPPVVFAAPADEPAALVAWRGGLAVAAGRTVRGVEGGAVVWEAALPGRALALAAAGDTLWAGTDAGLVAVGPGGAASVEVPGVRSAIVALEPAPDGRLWAATLRDGVWARAGGRWRQVSDVAPVTGVVAQGGAVWLGTQQGVVRREAGDEVRFTEEGTTDHGLLDNVVDRMVGTADGVVWAVHPQGVSVFSDGEPHGFSFVGRQGAALHDVVALPGGGHLLATADGLLLVPALSGRPEGFYEVYADSGADARPVAGAVPAALGGAPAVRLAVVGDAIWLASRGGLWSVPASAFRAEVAAR